MFPKCRLSFLIIVELLNGITTILPDKNNEKENFYNPTENIEIKYFLTQLIIFHINLYVLENKMPKENAKIYSTHVWKVAIIIVVLSITHYQSFYPLLQ